MDKIEAVLKWTWFGPLMFAIVMALVSAWAVDTNARIKALEVTVNAIDRQNVAQGGQFELIITRLNIMSNRLETLVQQHIVQERNSFQWKPR